MHFDLRYQHRSRARGFTGGNFSSRSTALLWRLHSLSLAWNLVASSQFLRLSAVSFSLFQSISSLCFLLCCLLFFIRSSSLYLFSWFVSLFLPRPRTTSSSASFFLPAPLSFSLYLFACPASRFHPPFLSVPLSPDCVSFFALTILVYCCGTLNAPRPFQPLFLLFLFLHGPSSFSFVRRPSPNLAPVLSSTRARGPVFFALYFSPSQHLFYPLPKSIPIRQRLHGGSTAGTGPSRKDSLKRQPTPATAMPVAGCRCYWRRSRPATRL